MSVRFEKYKERLREYRKAIDREMKRADYIISKVGKSDEKLVDDIYGSALIKMCIAYESFTSEAYKKIVSRKNIVYNKPWDYTRKIARNLGIDISLEYDKAREAWEIYNSLKHVNNTTIRKSKETENKLGLHTARHCAMYMHDILVNLLIKLDSTKFRHNKKN